MTSVPQRVAFVTGAAGGIGAATVQRLLDDGYGVTGFDVRDARADHPRHHHVVGDVRDVEALRHAVETTVARFGRLDAVVAAAAVIAGGEPLWRTPEHVYDELMDVDAKGVWRTASVTVPVMLAGADPSGCRFVAVASAAAHQGLFSLSAYTAAKHAVIGIVRGLAADLVNTGVTAVAVSPGSTRTEMLDATAAVYGLDDVEHFAGHQLLGRLIEPDEVAEVLALCCAPGGAVLNGGVLHAGGGFS